MGEWYKVPEKKKLHKARGPLVEFFLLPIRLHVWHQKEYWYIYEDGRRDVYWSD